MLCATRRPRTGQSSTALVVEFRSEVPILIGHVSQTLGQVRHSSNCSTWRCGMTMQWRSFRWGLLQFGSSSVDGGAEQRASAANRRHRVPARCESGDEYDCDDTDAGASGVPWRPRTGQLDHLCLNAFRLRATMAHGALHNCIGSNPTQSRAEHLAQIVDLEIRNAVWSAKLCNAPIQAAPSNDGSPSVCDPVVDAESRSSLQPGAGHI